MKRASNLIDIIALEENIQMAFYKASKGKKDHEDVIYYAETLYWQIPLLQHQILNLELDIGHYHFFEVYDPKRRSICAASFPERVLHHAIMNICEPVLDACAIYDSYACRKGKGNLKALKRAQKFARQKMYYLKLDIKKYFDSIDHDITLKLLLRKIKDRDVILMFQSILDTYHTSLGKGLPIGNLISQHLANYYLNPFDHWIKEELGIKGYVRYMDDFILFEDNKTKLKHHLERIHQFLHEKLKLELKHNIQLNYCSKGFPFLGFRIFPNKIRFTAHSRKRFIKKFKKYERKWITDEWTTEELVRHMEPLFAHAKMADTKAFRKDVINRFGVSF